MCQGGRKCRSEVAPQSGTKDRKEAKSRKKRNKIRGRERKE